VAKVTSQQWLTNWANGLNGAGAKIKAGVGRVSVAPGVAAAAKEQKMLTNTTAAIQSGKWSKNVQSVSLSAWQTSMTNKGIANISSGTAQAQQTKVNQITQMLADNDAAVAAVAAMPTDTIQQRMAKAVAFMQARSAAAQH
jgi:hypothetical protein